MRLKQDIAITELSKDEFGRDNLVKLLFNAITEMTLEAHPAITFGIYGAWGEGKTSLMQMLDKELINNGLKTKWYNPWRIVDETKILNDFFSVLASICGKDAACILEIYARTFLISENAYPYSPVMASYLTRLSQELIDKENFSSLKDRISRQLRENNEHPVIFIDDVDRLNNKEIQMVFKIIRQIADFDNVIFVVGCDPAAVSDALDLTYPSARSKEKAERGRAFLEKIVQIPIQLPAIQERTLQRLINMTLTEIKDTFDVEVDEAAIDTVSKELSTIFKTRRAIIRYGNQLRFVLPTIHKETEFVDLCLMESLKYLNEQGWLEIYRQKSNLFGETNFIYDAEKREETQKKLFEEAINKIIWHYTSENHKYVESILRGRLFNKRLYPINHLSKAINNTIYFAQYFTCSVPEDIISRDEMLIFADLINESEDKAIDWINEKNAHYSENEIYRTVRLKLDMERGENTVMIEAKMCRVLSFSELAQGYSKHLVGNPYSSDIQITAVIIPKYMIHIAGGYQIPDTDAESSVLKDIFTKAPFNFCMCVLYGIYSEHSFAPKDEKGVFNILKDRLTQQGLMSLFEYSFLISKTFLKIWKKSDKKGYSSFLSNILREESFDVGSFIVSGLSSISQKDHSRVIQDISDLFKDEKELFVKKLRLSSEREKELFKSFVSSCEYLKGEI